MNNSTRWGFRHCVYGGQYGSEGKGCVAEHLINRTRTRDKLVVLGENAPNSGHTNTKGKTRSMPVSAYFADWVFLGPDSVIDHRVLVSELENIRRVRPNLEIVIHEHAAMLRGEDIEQEKGIGLEGRVASTVTGGGAARCNKALMRAPHLVMRHMKEFVGHDIRVVDSFTYQSLLAELSSEDWLFECSQGLMLDLNLGLYPYVTSRTTHPRVAIERNGLGPSSHWRFTGVFRTYPIRTGGHSGPTGGRELQWEDIAIPREVATVTGRVRRVFDFSASDFLYSFNLVKPEMLAFTHVDYLPTHHQTPSGFRVWLDNSLNGYARPDGLNSTYIFASKAAGVFDLAGVLSQGFNEIPFLS